MTDTIRDDPIGADPEQLALTARECAGLCGFLAEVFRKEPTPELLEQMRDPPFRGALVAAGLDVEAAIPGHPEGRILQDLAVEYTHLFIGPGKHIPPYESVHIEGGYGELWGQETGEVKEFIESAGLGFEKGYGGIPDHFSVELDFMREIAGREAVAWQWVDPAGAYGFLEIQRRFLVNHLAKWVFSFCNKVVYAAELPFYREMARLTGAFLQSELEEVPRRLEIADRSRAKGPDGLRILGSDRVEPET